MNRYGKLGKNVALLTLGNFASKVLSFLLVPLYTAVLSTEAFGTADIITTSVNLFLPIFTGLIYEAVMRFALEKDSDKTQVFSGGFWITFFGSSLVVFLFQLLRFSEEYAPFMWLIILYFISLAFYNLILQYVKGKENVQVYAIAGVANTLVYICSNIFFLLVINMGVKGYLLSFVIGHTASLVYAFFAGKVYKDLIFWSEVKRDKLHEMLRYSLPLIPNSLSWWVSNSSGKYILLMYCGAAVNGIFSVSYKIPSILTIFVTIFIGAWQISAVDEFGSEESREFFSNIYRKYEAVLFMGGALLVCGTKVLASFLFSNDFYSAWLYTPVLIVAFIFNSLGSFFGSIYTSAKKTSMLLYSTLLAAVLNVVFSLILIPKFLAMGAAIATLISYSVLWFIRAVDSKRIIKLETNDMACVCGTVLILIETVFVCVSETLISVPAVICTFLICLIYRDTVADCVKLIQQHRDFLTKLGGK